MSETFFDETVKAAQAFEKQREEVGGLPEIWEAAAGLFSAIGQTGREISEATFNPDRFPAELTPFLRGVLENQRIGPELRQAIEEEGAAGGKRLELAIRLTGITHSVHTLIHELVDLRADMIAAQEPREVSTGLTPSE